MININIGVFAFDFPHKKTQDFLLRMFIEGYNPNVIIGAPYKDLGNKENITNLRIKPKHVDLIEPKKIAEKLNIPYYSLDHNSPKTKKILEIYNIELGIIAGARILSEEIISCCKSGIINFHPGILPENRGLDTLKWALYKELPIGVSVHYINKKIDSGKLIMIQEVELKKDDTLIDISIRLAETHLNLIPNVFNLLIKKNMQDFSELHGGFLHSNFPFDKEEEMLKKFKIRKSKL